MKRRRSGNGRLGSVELIGTKGTRNIMKCSIHAIGARRCFYRRITLLASLKSDGESYSWAHQHI